MGSFSVAVSVWAFATLNGDSATLETAASKQKPPTQVKTATSKDTVRVQPVPKSGLKLESPQSMVAGFRMEGSPELDLVFGDSNRFRAHIDRFFGLESRMRTERETFSEATQAALLTVSMADRGCPEASLSGNYQRARRAADAFRRHGADFEAEYRAIITLDQLGETAGLTPDYRWRVAQVRERYQNSLTDLREMHVAMADQLEPELRARGCDPDRLLAAAPSVAGTSDKGTTQTKKIEVVTARNATFFIDNKACTTPQRVVVDEQFLGEVAPGTRSAFQALTGHHSLCLRTPDQEEECSQTGVSRSVYIHDGWSLTLHCEQPGKVKGTPGGKVR
jgi:hypothetical protein